MSRLTGLQAAARAIEAIQTARHPEYTWIAEVRDDRERSGTPDADEHDTDRRDAGGTT